MTFFTRPLMQPRFRRFYREYHNQEFRILDVGCGNHSARFAKRYFPKCQYFGVDREIYNNDEEDMKLMERLYLLDLDVSNFDELPDDYFDVILMSHVIEHARRGITALQTLACKKLKTGGVIYVEFPSVRSLAFPSMPGTLHFCDDVTHVRLYDTKEIANALLSSNCRIIKAATRRWVDRVLLLPLTVLAKMWQGKPTASCYWDLLGFADFVYARKIKPPTQSTRSVYPVTASAARK
jgi:SAM-dependent methyltransferase